MTARLWLFPFAVAVLLAGCESSIYRTDYLDGGKSVVTDAKQRIVTNTKGNVSWGKNRPKRIVCAEPSPDVAEALSKAISASFSGAAQGRGNVSADVSASMSAGIVQLGERLATVQLLRDGLYRACEAYSNGAISDATYSLIVSRVDQTMVALLGMEMAAGAFGRDLAAIGGSAGGNSGLAAENSEEIAKLRQQAVDLNGEIAKESQAVDNAEREIASLKQKADAASSDTERDTINNQLQSQIDSRDIASENRRDAEGQLVAVEGQIAAARSASSFASATAIAGGGTAGGVSKSNAEFVAQIQQTFTDQDKLGPLLASCVTALDASSVYKAHVHRSQDVEIDRDENGNLVTTGPRTTPLSDLCYQMMKPVGQGPERSSILIEMFKERNDHAERLAIVKATEDMFSLYFAKCSGPEGESHACKTIGKALANMVLRKSS